MSDSIQSMEFCRPENWSALSLLQGIFTTQGSNPGLPHWRQILYQLSHKGSPRMLVWVAYPFSRGSSWPRGWTRLSCIAGGFFLPTELWGKPYLLWCIIPIDFWMLNKSCISKIIPLGCSVIFCTLLDLVLEKAMAPHSSTLAWKIPWMEEPDGLQSMGSLRVGHDWVTSISLFTFMHWRRKWQPAPVFLPGESQGQGSLEGCCLWGRIELDTTEVT